MFEVRFNNLKTFAFVMILCFSCALILSILTHTLRPSQVDARELYKSKQLLQAAGILSYQDHFILHEKPAIYDEKQGILIPVNQQIKAKSDAILALYNQRVLSRLTDNQGNLYTFEELRINPETYFKEHAKYGYANLEYKLLYIIQQNLPSDKLASDLLPYGYVIPINGYGLWDAIYGYLGLAADANTVLGITWYDQKETPGLGGDIALPTWQKQFENKVIFQKSANGQTNFERASLGIRVVKTTVEQTYRDTPIADSAVDGIAGASLTVLGVNEAFRNSLGPYRSFLIRAHERTLR